MFVVVVFVVAFYVFVLFLVRIYAVLLLGVFMFNFDFSCEVVELSRWIAWTQETHFESFECLDRGSDLLVCSYFVKILRFP